MSDSKARERAQELAGARDRAFDALLEQELGGEPPVDAILQRGEHGPPLRTRSRSWLAAALALLGIGVVVALAWSARVDRDDHNSATPQEPSTPVDVRWPAGVHRIFDADKLSSVPRETTHLELGIPLHVARDLSRFDDLQHLSIRLATKKLFELLRSGIAAKAGVALEALATAPKLRRLSMHFLPIDATDLAGLRHVEHLQVLELGTLFRLDDALRAQAARGGKIVGLPFDRSFGAAVAVSSRAKTLRLTGMPITVEGLQALADAKLHSLIIEMPHEVTPEVLLALGELTTLRHLELSYVHSAAVDNKAGGQLTSTGSRALSVAVMERIAALPELRSLTLDACFLDHDLIAALPRQLQRLDLSSCFGIDARLADVVTAMPHLRELGLPLVTTDGDAFDGMWRPRIGNSNAHTLRLSGADASAIIASRVWQGLQLDGRLTESVSKALADQVGLQDLTLTPSSDSVSLAFVAKLPKLERVTFVQVDLSKLSLEPLNECASLRSVVFGDCMNGTNMGDRTSGLRDDVVTRWGYRVVW